MIKVICSFKKLDGPRADGGFVIQFDVSETFYDKIANLPALIGKNIVLEINNYIDNNGNTQRIIQEGDTK